TAFLPIIGVKGFPQQDPFQVLVVSAAVAAGILLFVFGAGGLLGPDPPCSTGEAEAGPSKKRLSGPRKKWGAEKTLERESDSCAEAAGGIDARFGPTHG